MSSIGYENQAHNSDYNNGSGEFNSTHTSLLAESIISKLQDFRFLVPAAKLSASIL